MACEQLSGYGSHKDITARNIAAIKAGEGVLELSGAYIATAGDCNFQCNGCFLHVPGADNTSRLSIEEMKGVVRYTESRGGKVIAFAGKGEPLMDPALPEILAYIRERKMESVVFTNGTLIGYENANLLLSSGSVIAKRNSMDSRVQDELAGVAGADKRMRQGLEILLKTREEKLRKGEKCGDIGIDTAISRKNMEGLPDLLRYCRNHQIIPYFEAFIELGQTDETNAKMALTQPELNELFLELQRIDKDEFGIETPVTNGMRTYGQPPCDKWGHMVAVTVDGGIEACICGWNCRYGNIHDGPTASVEENMALAINAANAEVQAKMHCSNCSKRIKLGD